MGGHVACGWKEEQLRKHWREKTSLVAAITILGLAACDARPIASAHDPEVGAAQPAAEAQKMHASMTPLNRDELVGVWRVCKDEACGIVSDGWGIHDDGSWVQLGWQRVRPDNAEPACAVDEAGGKWTLTADGEVVFGGPKAPAPRRLLRESATGRIVARSRDGQVEVLAQMAGRVAPVAEVGTCIRDNETCTADWQCFTGVCVPSTNKCFPQALVERF